MRERRARPRLTVGENSEHFRVFLLNRPRQNDDGARVVRNQCKPSFGRAHVSQLSERRAQPSDFDAQPRAMLFISLLAPERPCDKRAARHVVRPCLAQRTCQREQNRARGERDRAAGVTDNMAARVHHERF